MVPGVKACELLLKIRPSWKCCDTNANALSSGFLVAWDTSIVDFTLYHTCAGILIEGRV